MTFIVVRREGTRDVYLTHDSDIDRMARHRTCRYEILFESPYFHVAMGVLKDYTRQYREVA